MTWRPDSAAGRSRSGVTTTLAQTVSDRLERAQVPYADLARVRAWNAHMRELRNPDGQPQDCGWPSCPHRGRCQR